MHGLRRVPLGVCLGVMLGLALLLALGRTGQAAGVSEWQGRGPGGDTQQALTSTAPISATAPITGIRPITATQLTPVEPQPAATATPSPATGILPPGELPVMELQADEVLTGTIVHNSTPGNVLFFLGNDLYDLPPNRAVGLGLVRPLAALTFYSCPPNVFDNPVCDWVSVPIRRSAFYEISQEQSAAAGGPGAVIPLAVAVAQPPALEVSRIQNRTGADVVVLRAESVVPISNTSTLNLENLAPEGEVIYLSRCLLGPGQPICEWLPTLVSGGIYYTLAEVEQPTAINGVRLASHQLTPLLVQEARLTPTPTPTPEPQGILCQTQIPSLNVRAGPGTSFLIVGKLRTADENRGQVLAIGRDESGEWLAVDPQFIDGGWVAFVPQWITCEGNVAQLPLAEVTDGRPAQGAAQPAPAAAPTPVPAAPADAEPESAEEEPATPAGPGVDQALLIATNAFDNPVRFTLDAAFHGLPEGTPSEYDLEPGESRQFIVRAGQIRFSASTAWRGGAGNAEFPLAAGATRELFIRFEPSADNPDRWEMRYE